MVNVVECLECVAHIMPIPTYWLDLNQRYLGINEAALNVIGLSCASFIEKIPYDIYPEEVALRIINHHKKVIETQKLLSFEESFLDPIRGEVNYFNTVITPLLNENGNIIGTVSTSVDVTSEKKQSQLLNKEQIFQYLKIITSFIPANVYWLDLDNVILGVNDYTLQAVGVSFPNDIIGKTVYDLYPKEMADEIVQHHNEAMHINGTLKHEEVIKDVSTGKIKTFSAVKAPLHDNNGIIIGTIGISMDITKEKQAEIAKADFLSNMEHDLRTPFAGIGGVAEVLFSIYSDKYPELKDLLGILVKSCTSWQMIHNRIFDALDLQQGIKMETFYLQDELEKIHALMQATSKTKDIDFILDCPSHEATGPITTDKLKLSLILSSLTGNAFNFTEKGQVVLRVSKTATSFIIDVIDTGIGIPEDKLDYIFEKFTKLSRSNTYGSLFKGMGMGLTNSKRDAEKINGTITVSSIVNQGSTFTLTLPIGERVLTK